MGRRRHFRRMCREAGSEVANDVAELFISAFEEAGLNIIEANYLKPQKADGWCVFARGKHPDWEDERWSSLMIEGYVSSTGEWPDSVKISCMVPAHHGLLPICLEGRCSVKTPGLIGELQ
jgi:hypothetical protein